MDYQEELKRLQESGNYWKPKVGQYKIKALSELEDTDPFIKERTDGAKEEHPQAKIQILVDGEEKVIKLHRVLKNPGNIVFTRKER